MFERRCALGQFNGRIVRSADITNWFGVDGHPFSFLPMPRRGAQCMAKDDESRTLGVLCYASLNLNGKRRDWCPRAIKICWELV